MDKYMVKFSIEGKMYCWGVKAPDEKTAISQAWNELKLLGVKDMYKSIFIACNKHTLEV